MAAATPDADLQRVWLHLGYTRHLSWPTFWKLKGPQDVDLADCVQLQPELFDADKPMIRSVTQLASDIDLTRTWSQETFILVNTGAPLADIAPHHRLADRDRRCGTVRLWHGLRVPEGGPALCIYARQVKLKPVWPSGVARSMPSAVARGI